MLLLQPEAKSRRASALPCARHGWLPLRVQGGALPVDFGALLPDDLGGPPPPDLGAGQAGELGCVPPLPLARLNWPTSPDAVRPELLRETLPVGRKPAMASAHCSAVGRTSGSPVHLTTRSAISCGASSGTLHAPARPASEMQCHRIGSPVLHTLQGALRLFQSVCMHSMWQKLMTVMPSLCIVKVVCPALQEGSQPASALISLAMS